MEEAFWREEAPKGKFDLVVDLNFRMDTTALYSDIDPAGGHLVREERPEHHRPALLHPSAGRRRCRPAGSPRATGRSSS